MSLAGVRAFRAILASSRRTNVLTINLVVG